jgi:molecular chaperone IbpA
MKGEKMTKITSFDLTPFYRNTVGIDRLFDRITSQIDAAATGGNYPPYDIVKTGDDTYEIRVAAAGFRQGEIDVEFHEGRLTIHGNKNSEDREETEYLHHGISSRAFTRTFTLADYVEVKGAVMQDGILTVQLERIVPETMKPKSIAVTYTNS